MKGYTVQNRNHIPMRNNVDVDAQDPDWEFFLGLPFLQPRPEKSQEEVSISPPVKREVVLLRPRSIAKLIHLLSSVSTDTEFMYQVYDGRAKRGTLCLKICEGKTPLDRKVHARTNETHMSISKYNGGSITLRDLATGELQALGLSDADSELYSRIINDCRM